jgi:hypothetical protein
VLNTTTLCQIFLLILNLFHIHLTQTGRLSWMHINAWYVFDFMFFLDG